LNYIIGSKAEDIRVRLTNDELLKILGEFSEGIATKYFESLQTVKDQVFQGLTVAKLRNPPKVYALIDEMWILDAEFICGKKLDLKSEFFHDT